VPGPSFEHRRHERLHPAHDAEHVDVQDPPPVVERHGLGRTEHRHPGVVAQQVDLPESVGDRDPEGFDVGVARHVTVLGQHVDPEQLELRRRLGQPSVVHVGDREVGPALGEGDRDALADAAGPAGDHRDRSFVRLHACPSLVSDCRQIVACRGRAARTGVQ
jgi:hypothetical protein